MVNLDLKPLFNVLVFLSIFGVWKLLEIIVWVFMNVSVGLG